MNIDQGTVRIYLQGDKHQLDRLRQEPPDGDNFLEEADNFYLEAQEYLEKSDAYEAYRCHLYLESYIAIKLEEVKRDPAFEEGLEQLVALLGSLRVR